MSGLKYIHSKGIIHRDIKSENLMLDNNMKIKIGDLGTSALFKDIGFFNNFSELKCGNTYVGTFCFMSPEIREGKEYNEKTDIYSMGETFYEICYFSTPIIQILNLGFKDMKPELDKKNVPYTKELLKIINLMLEKDKDKRLNSEEIYNLVKNEYEKKYGNNNSSIDSIIRCLYCFKPLTKYFLNIKNLNKPITNAYIESLKAFDSPYLKVWIKSITNIREILGEQNVKFEGNKELDPRFVFSFLIDKLHNELNEPRNSNNNNKHFIIDEKKRNNKIEIMTKFIKNFLIKFKSIISNSFMGLIKETKICKQCNIKTYSFKSYFFITFDLEKIIKNNNKIQILNLEDTFENKNNNVQIKEKYCSNCLIETTHTCQNFFFSAPNLLIISIQRGINYQYKTPININPILDITNYIEFKNAKKFYLVGVLKRDIKNGREYYFSIINIKNVWIKCEGKSIQESKFPSNDNSNGDIIMLFYQAIE